ncbi:hypothetical protein EC973_005343 [Apophysomyces ossiformis]|uniref:Oxo-4-hydroxy-4-carboxy-5-ureidoimidazoline decarboxylase domain-containing protein n=1 Tax=Apophysomyces ossiformis TaxID=679940 RepID=A0A8H7BWK5_9FUNG|nr:hypothetical protein EC973_005343 [Apophysomyces ossiformis]
MTTLPSIHELNQANEETFLETVNTLFETAPPLAQRLLAARPFPSYTDLIEYAEKICLGSDLTEQEKITVINAHPRIGETKANLSASSLREQGYHPDQVSLSLEDQQVNQTLERLNKEYEAKYGFKFIVFVAGRPRSQIIPIIRKRIDNSEVEKEMQTALTDMMLIARDRLKKAKEGSKI